MERGKLKIFFGYSAGVGKTYAMLKAAQELRREGVDIVIGYCEPHNRPDTIEMAKGLPTLPLCDISYKGITLHEFDVDGAIRSGHRIVLVDELAHTNAPGSKNRKRYLDVEELINNGIDVWTTVNVQHIEGLHDIVGEEIEVDVSERVPDSIFDYADEVVLIDIEPEDLIDRMRAGKIYEHTRAKVALENFFHTENLTSLRELFLRRGADRLEKLAYNGRLKTKVLVLISASPSSEKNIRVAARMSEAYHCKFSAMYVERNGALSDSSAQNLKKHIKLVEDLGGEVVVKYGDDIVETVADYVKIAGVTNLVLGKTWQSVGKKIGLEDKFIMRLPEVEILIVPDSRRYSYRTNPFKKFFAGILTPKKLMRKYEAANKTLDIIKLISNAALEKNGKREVIKILSRAFERSCICFDGERIEVAYHGEDISFFNNVKEIAVAEWCEKNKKTCGKGTDTLREANAIYFPIEIPNEMIVIGFSCVNSKMTVTDRMIFAQIQSVLRMIFNSK